MAPALPLKMSWLLFLLLGGCSEAMRTTASRSTHDALPAGQSNGPLASNRIPEKLYNHINTTIKYHNLKEEIFTFPERKPRMFNVMVATLKTWAADAVVQYAQVRRGTLWKFDWQRSVAFATFGFFYVGLMQWVLYVTFLTWLFPDAMIFANAPLSFKLQDRTGQAQLIGQVLVDNFVFQVLIYFPVFYVIKELVQGESSMYSRIHTGMTKYLNNVATDNIASCIVWVPAGFFVFASPIWCRMLLEHAVSFAWTMIISTMRGAVGKDAPKLEEPRLSNDALCS